MVAYLGGGGGDATLEVDIGAVSLGQVEISNDSGNPVPVSGTVTATGPLTDTQLRASNVNVAPNITRGSGVVDSNTQRVTLATDGPGVSALNSIDTKTPSLVNGRQPVDGSGVTQPVSAASLPLPTGAATSAAQTTTNSSLSSIDGKVPALQSGAVPIGDNSGSLTVDGKAYRAAVTITRPSNTTAYTAGDVVGDTGGSAIITLSSIGPSAGHVIIQSVSLVFSDSSVPSGMSSFRVHFYSASPTATADNAVFDLVSGERANYLGYVDLAAPSDLGSSLYTQADYCGRLVKLASASTSLFAEIETRGAYTPASASTVLLTVSTLEAGL